MFDFKLLMAAAGIVAFVASAYYFVRECSMESFYRRQIKTFLSNPYYIPYYENSQGYLQDMLWHLEETAENLALLAILWLIAYGAMLFSFFSG